MGRYKEAPFGFVCPYQNACPHLDGISATWASVLLADAQKDQYRDGHLALYAEKELKTLEVALEQARRENERLRAENQALHRRQFKPNRRQPDAAAAEAPQPPRKRGPPHGHPPWTRRPPDHCDRTVHVPAPALCPHCGCAPLHAWQEQQTCRQEDIVLQPRTRVTDFVHDTAFCPQCRRPVFQTAPDELRNCQIGPVTKATAVFLRHEVKLSYRDVRKVFTGVFGMPFVPASAMNFDRTVAARGQPLHEDLRNKIRAAHIAHADETHWRNDGQGAQLWYAGNPDLAFYLVDPSRGSAVAVSIFGENWPGNLVADDYAGYNAIHPARRQSCLAHLSRKAKELAEEIRLLPPRQQDPPALDFCQNIRDFMGDCCRLGHARNTGAIGFAKAKRRKPRLQRRLRKICRHPLAHPGVENLRQRLTDPDRSADQLFTFLDVNGMPPTNNHAEQSLRLPVILRKICFGNRSTAGADTLGINLSLLVTAKRQQRDPLAFLQALLLRGPSAAQPLLYRRPLPDTS
jgi:hypothetical protein